MFAAGKDVIILAVLESLLNKLLGALDPQLVHDLAILVLAIGTACRNKDSLVADLVFQYVVVHRIFCLPLEMNVDNLFGFAVTMQKAIPLISCGARRHLSTCS